MVSHRDVKVEEEVRVRIITTSRVHVKLDSVLNYFEERFENIEKIVAKKAQSSLYVVQGIFLHRSVRGSFPG